MDVNLFHVTLDFPEDFFVCCITNSYQYKKKDVINIVPFFIQDSYWAMTNVSAFSSGNTGITTVSTVVTDT